MQPSGALRLRSLRLPRSRLTCGVFRRVTEQAQGLGVVGAAWTAPPPPPEMSEAEMDALLVAKSFFDVREFRRAAHALAAFDSAPALFLRGYSLFLVRRLPPTAAFAMCRSHVCVCRLASDARRRRQWSLRARLAPPMSPTRSCQSCAGVSKRRTGKAASMPLDCICEDFCAPPLLGVDCAVLTNSSVWCAGTASS